MSSSKEFKVKLNEVDLYVGSRVRLRRNFLGITQEKLAATLGITPQQIQKYESGLNRIGASRLLQISHILEIPVQFFFEGLSGTDGEVEKLLNEDAPEKEKSTVISREVTELVRTFSKIKDPKTRRQLLKLIKTLIQEAE